MFQNPLTSIGCPYDMVNQFLCAFCEIYKTKDNLFMFIPDIIILHIFNYAKASLMLSVSFHKRANSTFHVFSSCNYGNIDQNRAKSILCDPNTPILFSSVIQCFAKSMGIYGDTFAVLTPFNLYLLSSQNYPIFTHLCNRSKIDEIVNDDCIIDKKAAMKISQNLNIHSNSHIIASNILPYFMGSTKREILFKILFHKTKLHSIASLFGLPIPDIPYNVSVPLLMKIYESKYNFAKVINCVQINMRKVPSMHEKKLIKFMFRDIPMINQKGNCVRLEKYYSYLLINLLNERKNKYCLENGFMNADDIILLPLLNKVSVARGYDCKVINMRDIHVRIGSKKWYKDSNEVLYLYKDRTELGKLYIDSTDDHRQLITHFNQFSELQLFDTDSVSQQRIVESILMQKSSSQCRCIVL
eukprot:149143_1